MITKEQAFENIRNACEERLREIYNAGIPDFAQERYLYLIRNHNHD